MNGDTLILLHGWGMNGRVFEPLLEQLSARQSVVNPDLPGYGQSGWDAALDFDAQLAQMAESLPAGRLLGWSMGGIYATELAARYPAKFSELILVCSNPCFVRRDDWSCAVAAEVFERFGEELAAGWQATLRRFLSLQMLGESGARGLIRSLSQHIAEAGAPDSELLNKGLDLLKHSDTRALLGQLQMPVRVILGERDALVPIALKQQISDLHPGIRVESLAGAAHAPFLSHSGEFAALLQAPY